MKDGALGNPWAQEAKENQQLPWVWGRRGLHLANEEDTAAARDPEGWSEIAPGPRRQETKTEIHRKKDRWGQRAGHAEARAGRELDTDSPGRPPH